MPDPGRGRPRAPARRDRRARGAERVWKDHPGADRWPACVEPQSGTVEVQWPRRLPLAGSGPLPRSRRRRSRRSALAVNGDEQRARAALGACRARLGGRPPSAQISRVASESGSRSRRSRWPSRTCSFWTSRRAASTPSARRPSPPGSRSTPRPERPCSSRPTTATCLHTAESGLCVTETQASEERSVGV